MGLWIDTDMGFDDLMAILVVRYGGLAVDALSLVAGNAPLAAVTANARRAAHAFGWTMALHPGRAAPLLGAPVTAAGVLGDTGLRTAGATLPDEQAPLAGPAFAALCRWLEEGAAPRTVLALGPLTNLAVLALARPDLAARIDDLLWMGGAVAGGNHTAAAEFNAYADPEAAAVVLGAGLPLRMVDLDLCRRVGLGPEHVAAVRTARGSRARLLADLLEGYVGIAVARGRAAQSPYDAVAAAALVDGGCLGFAPAAVAVELCGTHTRGRTVVDRRPGAAANARVATDVDVERVRALVLEALLAEAGR